MCTWGEGWPPPLLEISATSVYIQRLQKQWVAKPIYEEKSYQFVHDLLSDIILLKKGENEVPDLERPYLPQKHSTKSPWKQRRHHCKACVKISMNFSLIQVTGYIVIWLWYYIVNSLYCEFTFNISVFFFSICFRAA